MRTKDQTPSAPQASPPFRRSRRHARITPVAGERVKRVATGLWLAMLAVAGGGVLEAQDGKLDKVRDTVRDGDNDEHEDDDDWLVDALFDSADDDWFDGFGRALAFVVLVPFRAPREILHDEGAAPARFQEFPWRDGPGYWIAPEDVPTDKHWSLQPRFELGTDYDGLERTGLGLELEHESRFGLDLTWNRFREDLSVGTDQLDLGDANIVYRFAQSPRAAFRAGLGVNYLADDVGNDYGINTTYAAEFLPAEHVTLGLEGDFGWLGDATLLHFRASLGVQIARFDVYAAYDAWDIDAADLDSFSLGLRAWF